MHRISIAIVLAASLIATSGVIGRAQPSAPLRSPGNASYSIDAALDPPERRLDGREVITWRNVSARPTDELRLHLYWNAWRNTRSTWMRETAFAGDEDAFEDRPEADWAYIDLRAVRLLGAAPPRDLLGATRFVAPDDGNAEDRTLAVVPLPAAVAPGATINVEVEWVARVPRTFARTGAIGNFFFLAQWFPKVAVLGDDGWSAHQFHRGTEFFADYGTYDVRLRVPSGWIVGATGREVARRENGDGTITHRYAQDDVHDFAWTTSPDFLDERARFEHQGLPPVEMRLLLQPEHRAQARRYFAATRAALRFYGEWFGAYPYGHVTIVDPAWQSGAGGMEYPTLFTGGARWLARERVAQPESVTVHEAGHQFWYGLVGNNEFEDAWLDEGLNTFSTSRVLDVAYPPFDHASRFFGGFIPWVHRGLPVTRLERDGLSGYRLHASSDQPSTPSWRYFPGTGTHITYRKTALWLHTLERWLGWPTLQRAMATFFARSQFAHPRPDDFFRVASEVSGRDLTPFFDQVFRGSGVFDYAVGEVVSEPLEPLGYVERGGQLVFSSGRESRAGPQVHQTRAIVRRLGDAIFPVDVVVTFADGHRVRERWDGRDRWRAYVYERPSGAVSVAVDPDRVLVLDVNYTNNSWAASPKTEAAGRRAALTWLTWLQDLLLTYGFFV
jgi:hypothetical protein